MNSIVIDSDILIDHLRGFQLATDFLSRVFQGEFTGYISVLTEMELLAGTMPKKNEKEMVENLLISTSLLHSLPGYAIILPKIS